MITIDEAIEILVTERKDHHFYSTDRIGKALALGIEALKRHRDKASLTFAGMMEPLPGETE